MPYWTIEVSPCRTRMSSIGDAEFVGGDLGEGGFLALAVRRDAGEDGDFAAGLDLDGGAFPAAGGRGGRGPEGADFAVGGDADAHQTALRRAASACSSRSSL